MSTDRIHGTLVFICDGCGDPSEEFPKSTHFNEALSAIKAAGWRVTHNGTDFEHHCSDCAPEIG